MQSVPRAVVIEMVAYRRTTSPDDGPTPTHHAPAHLTLREIENILTRQITSYKFW